MAKKAKKKSKKKAGRPKKVVTPAQMKRAEGYALDGCQTGTICILMDWDRQWVDTRPDILTKLTKKRAERKQKLRNAQFINATENHSNTMQVFLGVNELEQRDVKTNDVSRQTLADIAAIVGATVGGTNGDGDGS